MTTNSKLRRKLGALLALLCVSTAAFSQADILNITYGADRKQTLDLYLPARIGKDTPVLILIHGGAWVMGSKSDTGKNARDLRDRGLVVANVDYRAVSEDIHANDLVDDISRAVLKVRAISKDHGFSDGGYHISGISAGAHLALLYAYTTDQPVKSVTGMSAPTRLDDPRMLEVAKRFNLVLPVMLLSQARLEDTPENLEKLRKVSPYAYVKNIPTLLIHGENDDLVPISQASFLFDLLQKANIDSKLVAIAKQGHDVGLRDPKTETRVLEAIADWTKGHD